VNNYQVAGYLQIRLPAIVCFGGGDRLAEFRFQLRFGESPFFGGGGCGGGGGGGGLRV